MNDIEQIINSCKNKLEVLFKIIPIQKYQVRIEEIDATISSPEIWNNPVKASSIMKERQYISNILELLSSSKTDIDFYNECVSLFVKEEMIIYKEQIDILHKKLSSLEFELMMGGENDDSPAILTITAGAGGLEAANWVSMLLRMYCRWADSQGFKIDILDLKPSEEHSAICIDTVSIQVVGKYAFGYLKSEIGVHRLIRNSPFDSGDARHTSFAAVDVIPDIEDNIDIKINDNDISIEAIAAGGPGGQNANRRHSAIRIKHFPTGINIMIRNERDQLSNKNTALKLLKAKLYEIEKNKKLKEQDNYIASQQANAFGSQIRTTTLFPYSLVKDHRTGHENRNAEDVIDGNIQEFIISYLQLSKDE